MVQTPNGIKVKCRGEGWELGAAVVSLVQVRVLHAVPPHSLGL